MGSLTTYIDLLSGKQLDTPTAWIPARPVASVSRTLLLSVGCWMSSERNKSAAASKTSRGSGPPDPLGTTQNRIKSNTVTTETVLLHSWISRALQIQHCPSFPFWNSHTCSTAISCNSIPHQKHPNNSHPLPSKTTQTTSQQCSRPCRTWIPRSPRPLLHPLAQPFNAATCSTSRSSAARRTVLRAPRHADSAKQRSSAGGSVRGGAGGVGGLGGLGRSPGWLGKLGKFDARRWKRHDFGWFWCALQSGMMLVIQVLRLILSPCIHL